MYGVQKSLRNVKAIVLMMSLAPSLGGIAGARADSPWLYGIHWYSTNDYVEQMTDGKGVWVVENVNVYSSPSASGQKSKFQSAVANGHTIIVRLQPQWGLQFPANMSSYLSSVTTIANDLKNEVHIWQIGNEMDNYMVENGGVPLPASTYVTNFKLVRNAIRSVVSPLGPQMVLLGPPTAFSPYLGQMLNYLDLDDVDGFCLHAYGLNPNPSVVDSLLNFEAAYRQGLTAIDAAGFTRKPVFITEMDRCTDPANDGTQEPVSAQFLYLAFGSLLGWNSNPNNHPIVGAVWFVYPDDSSWACYSLRKHKQGPTGQTVNLWDAFKYAAEQNYPAGVMVKALTVRVPNTMPPQAPAFSRSVALNVNPSADSFEIINAGAGSMNYTVGESVNWLSVTPASGNSTGEADLITLTYNMAGKPPGTYSTTVTVDATGATGTPAGIPVSVRVLPAPGDMDGDQDVDLADFGLFQNCLSGSGNTQSSPACELALLDGDYDVDEADMAIFQHCLTGSGIPANPACAAP